MPVDSQSKRSSAINVASAWRSMWPVPDGTLAQADRQHVAFLYSGILAGALAGAVAEICLENINLEISMLQSGSLSASALHSGSMAASELLSGSMAASGVRNVLSRSPEIQSLSQKC